MKLRFYVLQNSKSSEVGSVAFIHSFIIKHYARMIFILNHRATLPLLLLLLLLLSLISLCSDSSESATISANDDFKNWHKTDGMGSMAFF